MSKFLSLVGYEYKKIFIRKGTLAVLVIAFIIVIMASIVTAADSVPSDKQAAHSKAGVMDENFIKEVISQNAVMIKNDENYIINEYGKFLKNDVYISNLLPYEKTVNMINIIYEKDEQYFATDGFLIFNTKNVMPIDKLTPKDAKNFYRKWNDSVIRHINNISLSENEKQKHLEMLAKVKTPFYNDSNNGYQEFIMFLNVIALILLVVIAICISPIFSNEYQSKADQILLTSRYGKNKIIYAKIFTGLTLSAIISFIFLAASLFVFLDLNGYYGYNMPIQTIRFYSTYPITILQATVTAILVIIFIAVFLAMIVMLFSARFKSPFSTVTLSLLIILIPALINVSLKNRALYQLVKLFPAKATEFSNIFSEYLFEIGGAVFTPPTFYIIFTIFGILLFAPFIYRSFRNHQIG